MPIISKYVIEPDVLKFFERSKTGMNLSNKTSHFVEYDVRDRMRGDKFRARYYNDTPLSFLTELRQGLNPHDGVNLDTFSMEVADG